MMGRKAGYMSVNRLRKRFIGTKGCFLSKSGLFFLGILLVGSAHLQGDEGVAVKPGPQDKCPVCGMFVSGYPDWSAEIIFKDGSYAVFDGSKDMFKYYFNISKYTREKTKNDISALFVTEYYTTKVVSARDVYFILGSDVIGPMGNELVPVKGREAAEQFFKDHKGKRMFTFDEITPEDVPLIRRMNK
jgi:nitrous oxide reductase accessory protein NosL